MKRIILVCAVFLTVLALAACGGVDNTPSEDGPDTSIVQSDGKTSDGEGVINDCYIKIISAEKGQDFVGDPVAVITYEWTNNSNENKAFSDAFASNAYQNGVKCTSYNVISGVDSSKLAAEVEPGGTLQIKEGYIISGYSDITVEIRPGTNVKEDIVVSKTFSFN